LTELPGSQCVFATDYPQGVRDDGEVAAYVEAVRTLGQQARTMLEGAAVEALIPDLRTRMKGTPLVEDHIKAQSRNL
jgi:hypothetical protein